MKIFPQYCICSSWLLPCHCKYVSRVHQSSGQLQTFQRNNKKKIQRRPTNQNQIIPVFSRVTAEPTVRIRPSSSSSPIHNSLALASAPWYQMRSSFWEACCCVAITRSSCCINSANRLSGLSSGFIWFFFVLFRFFFACVCLLSYPNSNGSQSRLIYLLPSLRVSPRPWRQTILLCRFFFFFVTLWTD